MRSFPAPSVPWPRLCRSPLPASTAEAMTFEWDLRMRHEHVQDDAFHPDTGATTARLRA